MRRTALDAVSWQRTDRRKRGIPKKASAVPKPPRPARVQPPAPALPAGWDKPARTPAPTREPRPRQDGHYVLRDLGPVPPTEPDEARAAALVMAGVAVRLDAAADLPRVLAALGLRGAS